MFELEIMITGYTIAIVSTSALISKYVGKKQLNNIENKIKELELKMESHIREEHEKI